VAVPKDYRPLLWIAAALVAVVALAAGSTCSTGAGATCRGRPRPAHEIALEALASSTPRTCRAGRHEEFTSACPTSCARIWSCASPAGAGDDHRGVPAGGARDPQLAPPQRSALATFSPKPIW
jgi:hypothetical protein